MMPCIPATWTAEQRRRYLDALLVYVETPGPRTRGRLRAASPGIEREVLVFADNLVERPRTIWWQEIRRLRDELDEHPPTRSSPGFETLRLLNRLDVQVAWAAYLLWPSSPTAEALCSVVGGEEGRWLVSFADAFRSRRGSAWSRVVLRPQGQRGIPITPDPMAAAEEPSSVALAQRRGSRRSRPRPSLRWTAAAAAAAIVVVAGATALVVAGRSTIPPKVPTPSLTAAWRLAGSIDQPAWQVASSGGGALSPLLSCPGPTTCFANVTSGAGSSVVEASTDDGGTWEARSLPNGIRLTAGLACPARSTCVGTGIAPSSIGPDQAVAVVTSNGGASWVEHPMPAGVATVVAATCPTVTACVGVATSDNGQAVAIRSTDGGRSWSTAALPSPVYASRSGLACSSPTACVLAGSTTQSTAGQLIPTTAVALYTDDGGATWTKAVLPTGLGTVHAISCAPGGDCLALAEHATSTALDRYAVVRSVTSADRTFQAVAGTGMSLAFVTSVSCPTADDCWASGRSEPTANQHSVGAVMVTGDRGTSWAAAELPSRLTAAQEHVLGAPQLDLGTVSAVSCSGTGQCVAVGSTAFASPTATQVVLRD